MKDYTHTFEVTLSRRYRRLLIGVSCGILAAISVLASFLLRFDFIVPAAEHRHLIQAMWIAVFVKFAVFRLMGKDQSWLQYFSLRELWSVLKANALASVVFTAIVFYMFPDFPRSVFPLDLIICFLLTSGARSSVRIYQEIISAELFRNASEESKAILIYGAGCAGTMVLKEIQANRSLRKRIAGFLDDDPHKEDCRILGVPVLGTGRGAAIVVNRLRREGNPPEEIVIAMPSATGQQKREALANCRNAGVPCRIVPSVGELLSGRVLTKQIREVSVLDLLGREHIRLDEQPIVSALEGKVVLVTGAGGSIGSEVCRQVARFRPRKIIAFDQAETDLFRIELEMRENTPEVSFVPHIGDITDEKAINEVIRRHTPDSIFHAAAYKHVPMMEGHVIEAAKNNIIGTCNVVDAARRNGVRQFLMISSDKAVNPTNIMGLTKRAAEIVICSMPRPEAETGTRFVAVRFGNVLGSNGSVIPLFRQQIATGGPVTVTHPHITRYFMTIPEAVQLVLQASTMGRGSEIFELDMGEPIKIADLARNMIRLSGLEPDKDIEIRYTGLRPGEKLYEELARGNENLMPTYHEKIMILGTKPEPYVDTQHWISELRDLLSLRDELATLQHLQKKVPEYTPMGRWAEAEAEREESLAVAAS